MIRITVQAIIEMAAIGPSMSKDAFNFSDEIGIVDISLWIFSLMLLFSNQPTTSCSYGSL